ncbi:MAG TPA: hypothetical protein VM121_03220 [Acidimicrobiales bacterium]|nr:hypothetical protein [Acidimicrobiales bacterium]
MTAATVGGQWGWDAWVYLVIPVAIYCLTSLTLFAFGKADMKSPNPLSFFFRQIGDSLERVTGFPGWSMAGALTGLMALLIAVIGFYWDVAWHFDNGRDKELFTPSHTMILVGLGGLLFAAFIATVFASLEEARTGVRIGPARIPWSAILLFALGAGGVAAFPLDSMWHDAYGIDVTLWSPTHLQLVSGGSLSTIAVLLMLAEGRRFGNPNALGRGIYALAAGTILVGLSTYQGEFDFGAPQFQVLYLPILVMAAAGITLVLSRIALGRFGTLKVVLAYLVLRSGLALIVGGALNHTVPRFPLYIASALLVEAVAWKFGTDERLRFAVSSGAAIGTVGLVFEMAWLGAISPLPTNLPVQLLVEIALFAPLTAVAAAVLGAGLGRTFSTSHERVPGIALGAAGVVLLLALAYPLPRNVGSVDATIRLQPVGDRATVEVTLDPPDAAKDAIAFVVTSWQGGGTVPAALDEVSPGVYRSSRPVPVSGSWKTVVSLARGDQLMAAPVYLPADPEIGAPEIPALPERTTPFVRNTTLLLREQHDGPAWPALAAYAGLATLVALWVGLMAFIARRVSEATKEEGTPAGAPTGAPAPPREMASR